MHDFASLEGHGISSSCSSNAWHARRRLLLQDSALALQPCSFRAHLPLFSWCCLLVPAFVNPCRGLRKRNQHHSVAQSPIRRPWEEGSAIKAVSPFSGSAKFPQGASLSPLLPQPHGAHFFFNARADRPGNSKLSSFMPCSDLRHCASELISWISNQKGS